MYTYKAQVLRVIDGDTVDLLVEVGFNIKIKERFRLYGIDTPETRTRDLEEKAAGLEAKEYLRNRLHNLINLNIKTRKDSKGKFGRYLCTLYDGNIDINKEMVKHGYAKPYLK